MTKASSPVPRATWIVALLLGAVLNLPAGQAAAQGSPLCFTQPGITNCISGRFLQFWQQNGGLPVFGYPITPQAPEQTPEGTFTVQYFERERFELQPNNPAPYDVLLGRLGDQLLQRQGIDWTTLPRADPSAPNYFPETGHAISTPQFYQYWSSNGLKDPTLSPYQHSLALFGLPLTEAYMTTNSSGDNGADTVVRAGALRVSPDQPARVPGAARPVGQRVACRSASTAPTAARHWTQRLHTRRYRGRRPDDPAGCADRSGRSL